MKYFIDVQDASQITPEFFLENCLKRNVPCIFRNLLLPSSTSPMPLLNVEVISEALSVVERVCLNVAVEDDENNNEDGDDGLEQFLLKHHHHYKFGQSSSSSSTSNNTFVILPDKLTEIRRRIRESQVTVEVSFREYRTMALKEFCAAQKGLFRFNRDEETNSSSNNNDKKDCSSSSSWYLKDWHFLEWFQHEILQLPKPSTSSSDFYYQLPNFMAAFGAQDDILQRFQRSTDDAKEQKIGQEEEEEEENVFKNRTRLPTRFGTGQEYKFVYAGGKGSATLPHFDVCATYSWSLNLSGQKVWKFSANEQFNERLLEKFFFVGGSDAVRRKQNATDKGQFDSMEDLCLLAIINSDDNDDDCASSSSSSTTTVIQNPGDIIFVPSCFVHEVRNITPCVSINHNWYAFPHSLSFIHRLVSCEVETTLKMIGEETVNILKRDKEEWRLLFNLTQQGGTNWCLNVVKRLLIFAIREEEQIIVETKDEKTKSNLETLSESLKKVEEIERRLLSV